MISRWSKGDGGIIGAVAEGAQAADRESPDGDELRGGLRALVYHAGGRLRRVEFSARGPRRVWQRKLSVSPRPGAFGRLGDLAVLERREGGVDAFAIDTGELHWHVEHPAELAGPLLARPDGSLLLVFADESWSLIDPASGKRLDRGSTRSTAFRAIGPGAEVLSGVPQAMREQGRCRIAEDASEVRLGASRFRPDGWQLGSVLARTGDWVFAALERDEEDGREGAAAVLHWPSLELSHVVELGGLGRVDREHDAVASVDGVALLRLGAVTAVFGPSGRLLARLPVRGRAALYDDGGNLLWRGGL